MTRRQMKMNEKKFNLIDEPWILVMDQESVIEEISLLEVFKRAPELKKLAGEIQTQDFAILRFLLAILHSIFSRYDLNGEYDLIKTPDEALQRWQNLWSAKKLPLELIEEYLRTFEEKFYLIHPEFPFYQIAGIDKSTEYTASKLNGELSESNNKKRLFPQRSGTGKESLEYSEAARWLLYVNGFDDTAAKKTQKNLPSTGAGWLGKLGLITAVGDNLFETMLLNLVLLRDGGKDLWGDERPVWELAYPVATERREIAAPDNLSELYTLQSRRLLLRWEEDKVIGFKLLGGDYFESENAFVEPMTLWRNTTKKKTDLPTFNPKRHDPSRQIWRDFPVMLGSTAQSHRPGLIEWLSWLRNQKAIQSTHFNFQIASVKYGDKDFMIEDVFGDHLTFSSELLSKFGESWIYRITDEIKSTDQLIYHLVQLANELALASGNSRDSSKRAAAREQAYFWIDEPFRYWLMKIQPSKDVDRMDQVCDDWFSQAKEIIRNLGKEMVYQSGPSAYVGRYIADSKTNNIYLHTSSGAYNRFLYNTSSRETLFRKTSYKMSTQK